MLIRAHVKMQILQFLRFSTIVNAAVKSGMYQHVITKVNSTAQAVLNVNHRNMERWLVDYGTLTR